MNRRDLAKQLRQMHLDTGHLAWVMLSQSNSDSISCASWATQHSPE